MIRRPAALLAALALVLVVAAPAFAATNQNPDHVGTPWNDAAQNDKCPAGTVVADGKTLWHFVLTGTTADSGLLDVTFKNAAGDTITVNDVPSTKDAGGTLHWTVITDQGLTLQSATTDATGDNLNLSHICNGGPPPVIPEAPFAILLPLVALAAFGGYLLINRRRAISVV